MVSRCGLSPKSRWAFPGSRTSTRTGLEVCWPDFGLTVTPNADNYCALLSNIPAGQRLKSLAMIVPVYLYGSVSVVPGGSGWTAARIGVGDTG